MQYISITDDIRLQDLAEIAGLKNINNILVANKLQRTPYIGKQYKKLYDSTQEDNEVPWEAKRIILNSMTTDSDIFEHAALCSNQEWKMLQSYRSFFNMLKIPDEIELPLNVVTLGNKVPVSNVVYQRVMESLEKEPHEIDVSVFNNYSSMKPVNLSSSSISKTTTGTNPFEWAKLPIDEVMLYSSISDEYMSIPAYPEDISDKVVANYTTLGDLLYTYEPWQLYQTSGPRQNSYTFHLHRDMFSGDHNDGQANRLIRFCQANCYPEYKGSAVNTSTVTLYIGGKPHITGVMTQVAVQWSGPLGHDNWYLDFTMILDIIEVSTLALNYESIQTKSVQE